MDDVLLWALDHEEVIFGKGPLRTLAQIHSEEAFECMVLAVEKASDSSTDPEKRKAIVTRKARNLLIDRLRRRYGVTKKGNSRVLVSNREVQLDENAEVQKATTATMSAEEVLVQQLTVGPEEVHQALRERLSEEDLRLVQLKLDGYSSEAIGRELGLTASNVRKRFERLRPQLAEDLAELTGLEAHYISLLLGARTGHHGKRGAKHDCSGVKEATT